uniref:ADP-ribosylation factor GTPase-activating protein AGD14 n=1 Tax=Cajanus cajan TaxID=3821 RepID=A0A151QYU0_CAJCA|nr:putative ADP-ribosylation factor GTPase-activating protein AGD14 [Cajanus cajan]
MASRLKEDEKNERVIRGLLKLEPNRRCINCNNLGPQYVCTNFWMFVCTNCSGIHQKFTHRVNNTTPYLSLMINKRPKPIVISHRPMISNPTIKDLESRAHSSRLPSGDSPSPPLLQFRSTKKTVGGSSSNFNSLESVLSELSVPASLPAQFSESKYLFQNHLLLLLLELQMLLVSQLFHPSGFVGLN